MYDCYFGYPALNGNSSKELPRWPSSALRPCTPSGGAQVDPGQGTDPTSTTFKTAPQNQEQNFKTKQRKQVSECKIIVLASHCDYTVAGRGSLFRSQSGFLSNTWTNGVETRVLTKQGILLGRERLGREAPGRVRKQDPSWWCRHLSARWIPVRRILGG